MPAPTSLKFHINSRILPDNKFIILNYYEGFKATGMDTEALPINGIMFSQGFLGVILILLYQSPHILRRPQNFSKSLPIISQNFVAFSEYMY